MRLGQAVERHDGHVREFPAPHRLVHAVPHHPRLPLLLPAVAGRAALAGRAAAALVALVVEAGWEIIENTPWIMDRYREVTISLDYFGDSVINSVFDIAAMLVGFFLASRLPVWLTVGARHRDGADRRLPDPRQSHAEHHHAALPGRGDPDLAGQGGRAVAQPDGAAASLSISGRITLASASAPIGPMNF